MKLGDTAVERCGEATGPETDGEGAGHPARNAVGVEFGLAVVVTLQYLRVFRLTGRGDRNGSPVLLCPDEIEVIFIQGFYVGVGHFDALEWRQSDSQDVHKIYWKFDVGVS